MNKGGGKNKTPKSTTLEANPKLLHIDSHYLSEPQQQEQQINMDSLQDHWPEKIIPVQSISESGARAIPHRYIKPPSERPVSAPNCEINPSGKKPTIPVVDLKGLTVNATECRATIKAISDACKEWGFFQVVNHGVNKDLVAAMKMVWRDFFRLPMDEKLKFVNSPRTYEGYGSGVGVEKDAILDWGDYFFLNVHPESAKNYDKWPTHPSSCREITEKYGYELLKLCRTLMRVLSISLGLDVGFLEKAIGGDDAGASVRVNYYPKCPQPNLTLGLSPHSDPGVLTILLADDRAKGLQVRKGDTWFMVQPVPNAFVVNIGDQLQVLSNGMYKSVEHRVTGNAAEEQFSIALFYNPRGDIPLCPARELVTADQPQLYKPMTFNEYRLYIRKNGPKGKTQVEALKAL